MASALLSSPHTKARLPPELVELIARVWGRIQRFARKHGPPFVVKILADGRIAPIELPNPDP
jgi:hypothetical protein